MRLMLWLTPNVVPWAGSCRYNLSQHARAYPALGRVVIPRVAAALSTPRLLVLEYVDGVPLLDVAMMDLVSRWANDCGVELWCRQMPGVCACVVVLHSGGRSVMDLHDRLHGHDGNVFAWL